MALAFPSRPARAAVLLAALALLGPAAAAQDDFVEVEYRGLAWSLDPAVPVQACVVEQHVEPEGETVVLAVFAETTPGDFSVVAETAPRRAEGALAGAEFGDCGSLAMDEPPDDEVARTPDGYGGRS
jgi:hypothetical protein